MIISAVDVIRFVVIFPTSRAVPTVREIFLLRVSHAVRPHTHGNCRGVLWCMVPLDRAQSTDAVARSSSSHRKKGSTPTSHTYFRSPFYQTISTLFKFGDAMVCPASRKYFRGKIDEGCVAPSLDSSKMLENCRPSSFRLSMPLKNTDIIIAKNESLMKSSTSTITSPLLLALRLSPTPPILPPFQRIPKYEKTPSVKDRIQG